MRIQKKYALVALMVGGLSLFSPIKSFAAPPLERGDALYDFLNLAFTKKIWNEDRNVDLFRKSLAYIRLQGFPNIDVKRSKKESKEDRAWYEKYHKKTDWIKKYKSQSGELPDNGVIHKWGGEITVGLGRPFDPEYTRNDGVDEKYELIEERIESLSSDIEKATGRKIRFISPSQERDDFYGAIRIIPMYYIDDSFVDMSFAGPPLIPEERWLWGAELFEGLNSNNMRGFIVPQMNNDIGFSVCKIDIKLPSDTFGNLVDECLLRSMGLAGALDADASDKGGDFFPKERALKVISMLYCPDIKSGMSKNKALYTLTINNQCKF